MLDLLTLLMTRGVGPVLCARLREAFGGADAVLGADARALRRVRGIGDDRARAIVLDRDAARSRASKELERAAGLGVVLHTLEDETYPPLLASIRDAPPVLYVRGTLDDDWPVAIVGSRRCTHYGLEQATRFARDLGTSGLSIVSGGARGIDAAAHLAAVEAGARTIAVLGNGLAHVYPKEHARLFDRIASNGAIVSELPLDTAPAAENFPARNRIIAGLSLGVVVIEAASRSGALITAREALDDGREVMALPGRVDASSSEGSHALLRDGAHLVTNASDVLQVLESPARHLFEGTHRDRTADPDPKPSLRDLPETERTIVEALPGTLDDLVRGTGLEVHVVQTALTHLELKGHLIRRGTRLERR